MSDFEQALDKLEDWLLRKIDRVESKEFMTQDLSNISEEIKTCRQEIDQHQSQYKAIKDDADRLVKQQHATDAARIRNKVKNCKRQWDTLKDAITKRDKQLRNLQTTTEKYQTLRQEILDLLDNMEGRLDQMQPAMVDAKELRLLKKSIASCKSNIDANCKNVETLDTLTRDAVQPLQSVAHSRFTQTGNISYLEQAAPKDTLREPVGLNSMMAVRREVCDVNARQDVLKSRVASALENLDVSKEWVKHMKKVETHQELVTASYTKIEGARPMSNDITQLMKEIEHFSVIHSDIQERQASIWVTADESDLFLHSNHDRLTSRQYDNLSTKATNLRKHLYDLLNRSEEWQKEANDRLLLQMGEEPKDLVEEIRKKESVLKDLLDWLAKAEQALASEQPMNGTSPQVKHQYDKHKLLHEDIQTRRQPILQCVEDIEQLPTTLGDRVEYAETKHLLARQSELRERYDFVLTQSSNRQKTLKQAIEDLQKLEADLTEFEKWLQAAECKMDATERNVAIELETLMTQQADHTEFGRDINSHMDVLASVNKSGQTVISLTEVYRQKLAEFRSTVQLQESGAFQEAPQTHILKGELQDVSNRFSQLKGRYKKLLLHFNELIPKHLTYINRVNGFSEWLEVSQTTLDKMKSEPIVASKETILRQIESTATFRQDVIAHAIDVKNIQANGKILISLQPAFIPAQQMTTGGIVKRYQTLEVGVKNLLEKLRVTLTNTQRVMESLDEVLKWLDEVEKEQQHLENGEVIQVMKQTILDHVGKNKALEDDIASHCMTVESVNVATKQLIATVSPSNAKLVQDKLNVVNDRYGNVKTAAHDHGKRLLALSKKLSDFEKEVDGFEDWLLPDLEILESGGLMTQRVTNTANTLNEIGRRHDAHKAQYDRIHEISEALLSDTKTYNTSYVTVVVSNVDKNYLDFKEAQSKRNMDCERKRDAKMNYSDHHRHTTKWLSSMEEKVRQLLVSGQDLSAIQIQVQEVKIMQRDVIDYKPKTETCSKLERNHSAVICETDQPILTQARVRSLQAAIPKSGHVKRMARSYLSGTGKGTDELIIERQLSDINRRYNELMANLNLAGQYIELTGEVGENITWVTTTNAQLTKDEPQIPPVDIESLEKEIGVLENLVIYIDKHKVSVDDVSLRSEQFVAAKKEILTYRKQDRLKLQAAELTDGYNQLQVTAHELLKNAQDELDRLKQERNQEIFLGGRLNDVMASFTDLLQWVAGAERRLGSEQPMSETLNILKEQARDHNNLNNDIIAHQQLVLQVIQKATQVIDQLTEPLKPSNSVKLQDISSELKGRYDAVLLQSQIRQKRLTESIPVMAELLEDHGEITSWLADSEHHLEEQEKDIGRDLNTLKVQLEKHSEFHEEILTKGANIRFLNMIGKKHMDGEKADRQGLYDFRKAVLPQTFNNSFREEPETTIIRDKLAEVDGQYADLKNRSLRMTKRLRSLVDHHQLFENAIGWITPWLGNAETTVEKLVKEPISTDPAFIEKRIEKMQRFMEEVDVYESNIMILNRTGESLNALRRGVAQPVPRKPLYQSTQLGQEALTSSRVDSEPYPDDETSVKHDLYDVNQRYADLRKRLIERQDELHVVKHYLEETDNAKQLLAWVEATQTNLKQCKPKSQEIETLRKEIESFKVLLREFESKQPQLIKTVTSAGDFKRDFRDKLTDDRLQLLEETVDKLKALYDQVCDNTDAWLRDVSQKLENLVKEEDEKVTGTRELSHLPTETRPVRVAHLLPFVLSIPGRLKRYGEDVKGHKLMIIQLTVTAVVLITAFCLASERTQYHFEAGARGTITFDASWTARDGLIVFFNVRFESKSSTDNKEQFSHAVKCINDWLISSESTLNEMIREQIAADQADLQEQIDRLTVVLYGFFLQAFSHDVVNHSENIELVDAAGDLLAEDSTDMIIQIDATIFDIHTRYKGLLLSSDDRLQQLLVEIVKHSTDDCVCDQMPSQVNSERDYVLHKDVAVKIKKEPMQEDDQKYKVRTSPTRKIRQKTTAGTKFASTVV
ncbi:dystonin-like [Diadema antillarum]|uniref:dystonin-like n=1 Tax=Diadema antillarum TaxID=105358 RepID=UPI003A84C245